ncbi:MAG: PBP1A family penicillin-binding protein [Zetaproteobacteria bacterium]|nr:PBP1A family penicillin-binding protein [Zetaproteobacteria bacterium]
MTSFEPEYNPFTPERSFSERCIRLSLKTIAICAFLSFGGLIYLIHDLGLFTLSTKDIKPILSWVPYDNTVLYDRQNEPIAHLYRRDSRFVPLQNIPTHMINAVIATEDHRFWQHIGFDPVATLRAAWHEVSRHTQTSRQGGSTLTQQLVKHFLLTPEQTIVRKAKEIVLSTILETHLSKEAILELYLNTLFLGGGAYGVEAAAQRYFNRHLKELNLAETALIAGLFQSPSRFNPHHHLDRAKKRMHTVLRSMVRAKYISKAEAKQALKQPLHLTPYIPLRSAANIGYFKDFVAEQAALQLQIHDVRHKGLRVYTTLDLSAQQLAAKTLLDHTPQIQHWEAKGNTQLSNNVEAAIIAIVPQSGEILAMQGGISYKKSNYNRASQALRQPGSLFKTVVYTAALERGYRWNDRILVTPVSVGDNYRPRNATSDYLTETTLLRSFYRSMNAPTMEVGAKIGLHTIKKTAQRLGLQRKLKQEFGTILGSSEITMLDAATLFSSFANQCEPAQPHAIRKITDNKGNTLYQYHPTYETKYKKIDPRICHSIKEALRLVLQHGTGKSQKNVSNWAVGKTGTTNGARDNWFAGFSSALLSIVWVGSDDSKDLPYGASANKIALPIWADFMRATKSLFPPVDGQKAPDGSHRVYMNPKTGVLTTHGIPFWYLEEYPPRKQQNYHSSETFSRKSFRAPKLH